MLIVYEGVAVPKPRQTQADKYFLRPEVARYRAYANDLCKAAMLTRASNALLSAVSVECLFVMPFPKSYSKKIREQLAGRPFQQRPDVDNLAKAVLDSLWPKDDSQIAEAYALAIWDDGKGARVMIKVYDHLQRNLSTLFNEGDLCSKQ